MLDRYSKLGAAPSDLPYIRQFEQWASRVGIPQDQQNRLIEWACGVPRGTDPATLAENFNSFCAYHGIDHTDLIVEWHGDISVHGLAAEKQPLVQDASRMSALDAELADIRRQRIEDPDGWAQNSAIQDRELELLQAQSEATSSDASGLAGFTNIGREAGDAVNTTTDVA